MQDRGEEAWHQPAVEVLPGKCHGVDKARRGLRVDRIRKLDFAAGSGGSAPQEVKNRWR
jgi:hypothetical protein